MRRFGTERQAGVVDQHVDRRPRGGQLRERRADGGGVADVERERQQLLAEFLVQARQAFAAPGGGNHLVTVANEGARHFFAKTGTGAGDQNNHS